MRMFVSPAETRLPRVYFDDTTGPELACMNEHVGERLAIQEFNDTHPRMNVSKLAALWTERELPSIWNERIYVCHERDHPLYTKNVMPEGDAFRPLPLQ